ncbi:MAG: beta-propeller fold lactonase family protein [Candidatus Nealsonbacteria bacterium]|nr:beta-propeller fold lactonase family protein [Candidatus Nealsonbacteria bacterium]
MILRQYHKIAAIIGILILWPAAGADAEEYLGPGALVASKDGKTLYVACADSRQVARVALPGGRVTRRMPVPAEPTGLVLTPDGAKLIVTCAAPKSTVVVFDVASGEQVAAIRAGHTAMGPAIGPDGRRVYVCNRFDNDVSVIDLAAGREVTRVAAVREPIAAAVTPDGRTVLVANLLPDARVDEDRDGDVTPVVTAIDTRTHETTAIELPHGANGVRDVCILPDGKHALVTHLLSNFERTPFQLVSGWINTNVVSVIDVQQRKMISTIGMDEYYQGAGNPWEVTCTPDGKRVFVSISGAHELCVIDTAELLGEYANRTMQPMMQVWPIYPSLGVSLWRRIGLPGKGPRGVAVAGSKVYAAEFFSDALAVVDVQVEEGDPVDTIALGPTPQLTLRRRGELLFHDASICYQTWQSCASCHPDGRVDSLNWDLLNDGQGNSKNTKSMLLAHRTPPAMALGVRESAEVAVRSGIEHILFADRPEAEAVAIDAYLKSLEPVPSPQLVDGRLTAAAERGRKLFKSDRVACHRCHPRPLYTDLKAHNVGTRGRRDTVDRFDTPTLIEVWRTAPYLHDGRCTTIEQLIVAGRHGLRGVDLSKQQIDDLVEFVLSL